MSFRGVFITGTDTGVGKTFLAAAVVRVLRDAAVNVGAYKPVVSGSDDGAGPPRWRDIEELAAALDHRFPAERIGPQRFHAALAPPAAARHEGRRVDAALLRSGVEWWRSRVDTLVVEGAGGLLCPVSDDDLAADLARDLGFPLVVVARSGLGTINHTLLTVEVALGRGLKVAGVVVNRHGESGRDAAAASNPAEIARRCPVPVLGVLPSCTPEALFQDAEFRKIDWLRLCCANAAVR